MTTMVWTVALLLPLASLAAWASAAARGRGFRQPGSLAERFGRLPLGTRLAAAALACALWAYGGAKPGRARSALPPAAPAGAARALADEDFARGFVTTRIGTGEAFDFSPPPGAVVCDDWRAFGAAEDWIYLAFTNRAPAAGADAAARLRVFSSGKAERLARDGRFVYRYDLSRLDAGAVTNVCVGASLGGNAWTTNALPADVTSMAFHPLTEEDRDDPDADGDGLPTVDELFLHGTDPHRADTDRDGLTDYEELFLFGADPLNPRSVRGDFSDGVAARLGGLDPFARPEDSASTVLEHVFYSGTTNGAFALPQSSESMAVLRVSASGSGTGDLIVGNQVVPLAAPPRTRSAPSPAHPPLLVPLARGRTHPLYLRAGDGLPDVSLDSEDFAFGVLPTRASPGWINFPLVRATEPCIHDFNARRKGVSLPAGRDARLLACTWRGGDGVEAGGSRIRPIVLFQAQPKRDEDAATFDRIKAKLVNMGIPAEEIAIKTASRDELGATDLMAESCPVRYVITVNALKEGWDCPFAYILASLANKTSTVDVEQIVGRILRQPYARRHADPLLNMSFVLASSGDFQTTVRSVVEGLNGAGFSAQDYRVATPADDDAPPPPGALKLDAFLNTLERL